MGEQLVTASSEETREDYLTRRIAEAKATGRDGDAKSLSGMLTKLRFDSQRETVAPAGPTLAQWQGWLAGKAPDQNDALAFLDWCLDQGIVNDEQMANAKKLVRFYGDSWMTDELTRLARLGVGNANPQA